MSNITINEKTREAIGFDIAEKVNVVNILLSNFGNQIVELTTAETTEASKEHSIGLEVAKTQLSSFIETLITENGNLQLEINNLKNP